MAFVGVGKLRGAEFFHNSSMENYMFGKLRLNLHNQIRELFALRAKHGPYRFLVRTWEGVNDAELAKRLILTEYFKKELEPLPLPVEQLRTILVLAPHQDDEVIGGGGTLLLAAKAGVKIHVLYVTDGAQRKPGYTVNELTRLRFEESQKVCARLGAQLHQLEVSNLVPEPTAKDLELLAKLIHDLEPQVVMAPWLLDSPAKHRLTNHLLWLAHRRFGLPDFEVWGYQVHNGLFPNGYVDITNVADEKRELLEYYHSQIQFCRYDHIAMGLAAWNSHLLRNNSTPKYVEVFFTLPSAELLRLVESFYFTDLRVTYWGDQSVIPGMQIIHQAVVGSPGWGVPFPLWGKKNGSSNGQA